MPPPVELRNRPQDGISWIQKVTMEEEVRRWSNRGPMRVEGTPGGVGVPPTLVGPMELHRRTSFAYIYSYTLETSGRAMKPLFHRLNLLYP